jgi:hypothetical protein
VTDIDAIRCRHADAALLSQRYGQGVLLLHEDRGALLAEVHRLRQENIDLLLSGRDAVDRLNEEVDRLSRALRAIAFYRGDCDDKADGCPCDPCFARRVLDGGAA